MHVSELISVYTYHSDHNVTHFHHLGKFPVPCPLHLPPHLAPGNHGLALHHPRSDQIRSVFPRDSHRWTHTHGVLFEIWPSLSTMFLTFIFVTVFSVGSFLMLLRSFLFPEYISISLSIHLLMGIWIIFKVFFSHYN